MEPPACRTSPPSPPFSSSFILLPSSFPHALLALLLAAAPAFAELRIPASTAYLDPDPHGATISDAGVTGWTNPQITVSWFGEFKTTGKLTASVDMTIPKGTEAHLKLTVGTDWCEVNTMGTGERHTIFFLPTKYHIDKPGYARFVLSSTSPAGADIGGVHALVLDGPPSTDAHFNLDPRRNAASVHLAFPMPKDAPVALFYNEVTAIADPVATYYMACGFSRGYFGIQVNSTTERRIIFSVWDSGSGQSAKDRATVPEENRVKLLAKGEGVVAHDFGNEGTGGHSHLVYPWKTGEPQKFVVTAKAEDDHTDYTGYWFHPEQHRWMLIASFRAPHDGKWLRGLYSFNENFSGSNGHLQRKALFGPQWIRTTDDQWHEITEATFSHDETGKENRLDRFMGVEHGQFFLSNGGFIPGFTKFGEKFVRETNGRPPKIELPKPPAD